MVVNPSPRRFGEIASRMQNASYSTRAIGFGGYSEGASDDVNKAVWSALYLEPTLEVRHHTLYTYVCVLHLFALCALSGRATTCRCVPPSEL